MRKLPSGLRRALAGQATTVCWLEPHPPRRHRSASPTMTATSASAARPFAPLPASTPATRRRRSGWWPAVLRRGGRLLARLHHRQGPEGRPLLRRQGRALPGQLAGAGPARASRAPGNWGGDGAGHRLPCRAAQSRRNASQAARPRLCAPPRRRPRPLALRRSSLRSALRRRGHGRRRPTTARPVAPAASRVSPTTGSASASSTGRAGDNAGLLERSGGPHPRWRLMRCIGFWVPLANMPKPGDTFRITAGCAKTFSACREKFANSLNFRGFPQMPGSDFAYGYADSRTVHDGRPLIK